MITCEPSSSVIVAPARSAIERTTSVPAALSAVATTAHDGRCFHAGAPFPNFAAIGNPSAAAVPWPSINTSSAVLSLIQPQPQLESNFASIHHCSFWAAG